MDMAEEMHPRLLLLHRRKQLSAPEMLSARRELVENPKRRAMCDEYIQVVWDMLPPLRTRAARVHESPIHELWRIRRAPEGNAVDRYARVLKVGRIGEKRTCLVRRVLEVSVVIASTDYAMFERLVAKPTIEGYGFPRIVPAVHEIAGVHQNVSVGETLYRVVKSMGIGNDY
jgi:hypothetical protein